MVEDKNSTHGLNSVGAGMPHVSLKLPRPTRSPATVPSLGPYVHLLIVTDATSLLKCLTVAHFSHSLYAKLKAMFSGTFEKYHTETFQLTVGRSVCHNLEPCKKRLNRSRWRLGVDSGGPKEPCIRSWSRSPCEGAILTGNVICTANG